MHPLSALIKWFVVGGEHNSGMLGNLFYQVYDWEFIAHETFDLWREAVDDDKYAGKQVALVTFSGEIGFELVLHGLQDL